ncbi:FG-GAP-like repeat-containing protein [Dyadobacter luticola]|uniref:Teneurin-like YD-shell domain-containing protein n=1 Tax=Dyadobacter luticola TaxID=1979387 RepID=A0A5R9KRQ7_9BACT|nr:FG-GAP-like repeat-containing protein [Dyadobacter luticola]TLU98952.1 hypothetical protein FEN17_20395 [Dyadobacter luticola]
MRKLFLHLLLFFTKFLALAQNVDYTTPLYTNQTFTKVVNPALPVGSVAGSGGVSSGSATYSVPIAVPPGTNGVVPAISIDYNSGLGSGPVGNGWNISGLSVISRAGQNIYHDGQVTTLDFSGKDRFVWNGQRLLGLAGTYGASGATYATESENFVSITSNGISGAGPTWFKVLTKDGVEMEFGNTTDSRMMDEANVNVVFWRLNRVKNPDGNYIDFKYLNIDRDARIDEINYTGNSVTGLLPYNKIKFEYKIRGDINGQYIGNSLIASKYLLDKITITADGSAFKTYQFGYSWDNINSFLREVTESGSDGSKLNSTIFKYGEMPIAFQDGLLATGDLDANDSYFGDFNGDGKTDIMTAKSVNSGIPYVNYHESFRLHLSQPGTSELTNGPKVMLPTTYSMIREQKVPNNYNILAGDYTGDGLDDIVNLKVTNAGSYSKLDSVIIYETSNSGQSLIKHLRSIQPNYFKIHAKGNYFFPGDFDGDGITEYITILGNDLNTYLPFLCTNYIQGGACGSIGISGATDFPVSDWASADKIYVLDFNGDGKSDLMLIRDNLCEIFTLDGNSARQIYTSNFPTKDHLVYFGDFNGDRKTDLLTRASLTDNSATWTKAISTGAVYIPSTFTWVQIPDITKEYYKNHHVNLADFNGDGKTDIYHGKNDFNLQAAKLNVYYSRGYDFFSIQSDLADYVSSSDSYATEMDGDGKSDIMSVKFYQDPYPLFKFKPSGKENLLHKVANGFGHVSTWYYKTFSEGGSFYTKGANSTYPLNSVQLPLNAAFQFIVQNGIGGENVTQYSYEDARLHRPGKGLLGFKKIIVQDKVSGIQSVSENEFNATYYASFPKKTGTYWTAGNALISETTLTNEIVQQGVAGSKRFLYRVKSIAESNVFEGRTASTVNDTFDNYGNVTQSTVNNNNVETTVTKTTFGAYPGIIPNKPTSATIATTRSGQSTFTATTTMGYNALGQLMSKTDFSGLPKSVSASYEYFPLGNLKKTTIAPTGLPARSISATYDTKGRYPESNTNELGQISSATFDPKWGKPLTSTSIDGLVTTFTYDAFGRSQSTKYPEGYTVGHSYGWDIANGAIWFDLTTHPGKPDVKTWHDLLGREIKSQTEAFPSGWTTSTQTYDNRGNVVTSTQPVKSGEPVLTTTNSYDAGDPFNRIIGTSNALTSSTVSYAYAGGILTTTTTSSGQSTSRKTDATGKTTGATDNGGQLEYTYYSHGGLKEVKNAGIVLTSSEYDAQGMQTKLTDLNAGATSYDYNALGQLASQTNANGKTHTMLYDLLGRNTSRSGPEGTSTYEYYPSGTGASVNQLKKVTGFAGTLDEYTYDALGRLQTLKQTVDASAYTTTYGYNVYGDITSVSYPSGFGTNHAYDANAYPTTIKNANNAVTLYTNTGMNGLGQNTAYTLGNGKSSTISYNYGIPTLFATAGIQNLELTWDFAKGNLSKRKDNVKNKEETFVYDNLDRLLSATVTGKVAQTVTYQPSGNISSKSDAGQTFSYDQTKINALTGVISPTTAIPILTQDITYTAFNQPEKITENGSGQPYELTYTYGADYQRLKGVMKKNAALINTHYYFANNYEKDVTPGIADKHLHYIHAPAGMIAIVIRENGADQYYYTYTDHLGSLLTMTAQNGSVLLDQNFDAWGRLRHPTNWDYVNVPAPTSYLYRGFTGHEHLTNFNVINMNGRLYDPVVGRVLSVDNYVADPGSTQAYNRYSYANNNPLVYTDPDGEWVHIVIGAAVGGVVNLGLKAFQGKIHSFKDGAIAFGIGAAAGAVTAATGGAATSALGLSAASFTGGAVAGATGAATGGLIQGLGNAAYFHDSYSVKDWAIGVGVGGLAGGVLGGLDAAGHGKNFWTGAPKASGAGLFSFNNGSMLTSQGRSRSQTGQWQNVGGGDLTFVNAELGDGSIANSFGGVKSGEVVGQGTRFAKGGTEIINFGKTAAGHFSNPARKVPIHILDDVIKNTKGFADPGGSNALMHYQQIWKNGKPYNLEVLYDKASNSIWHFKYDTRALGPLSPIK